MGTGVEIGRIVVGTLRFSGEKVGADAVVQPAASTVTIRRSMTTIIPRNPIMISPFFELKQKCLAPVNNF
jgi:hypothetical protein